MSVLAYRIAGQGLATRDGDALRTWAVQDSPPGAAAAALLARGNPWPPADAVTLYNARTATAIVPAGEAAAFATALLPTDDAGLKALLGRALPGRERDFAEPVQLAVDAISDALDGTERSRDDLHEQLRQRLPREMLPWCAGCESHHVRRGLLVLAGLHGRLCIVGRAGRQPCFARTDQTIDWKPPPREQAARELVRRYLVGYGPSTPQHFAQWAGLGTRHARQLWELGAFEIDIGDSPPAPGVRLLAPGDPLLLMRDREVLLADPALRKRVWSALPTTGVVLQDGAPAALFKARKAGGALELTLDVFGTLDRKALRAEAEPLAAVRGARLRLA